jgi:hypothetical protein
VDIPDNSHSEQTWAGSVMKANDPAERVQARFPPAGPLYRSEVGGGTTEGLVASPPEVPVTPSNAISRQTRAIFTLGGRNE